MNINQLEYFVAVAENLNFTRAAEKCFISQTAMTQQIRALEKTVGSPLFLRDKHHVELTPAGKVFLNEAYVIIERTNEALHMARIASQGMTGELTIGFIRGFGQDDLAEILQRLRQTCPNIKLKLIKDNSSILRDLLEKKECDLIFTVASQTPRGEDMLCSSRYLDSYPVMCVLQPDHPLAGRKQLHYEDLKTEKFIMMQPASRQKDQMEESMLIYERGGYLPEITAAEGDQETLLMMIAAGMGISLLPEYITKQYQKTPHLKILPVLKQDGTAETLDLEVAWLKSNANPVLEMALKTIFL